ncbi:hypothetical protein BH10ACI2_BH10ACI2_09000 [soil metagenome]
MVDVSVNPILGGKMRTIPLRILCFGLIFSCIAITSAFSQKARKARVSKTSSYERLIVTANLSLKQSNFETALELSTKAIESKPADFRGYLVGIRANAGLGNFEDALDLAETARTNCPEESLGELDEITEDISKKKTIVDQINLAERRARDGNAQLAAEAYAKVWELAPEREEYGLKAATIQNDLLKNFAGAISIIKKLILTGKNAEVVAQARDLLRIAEENQDTKIANDAEQERIRLDRERRAEQQQQQQQQQQRQERENNARIQERNQLRAQIQDQIRQLESQKSNLRGQIQLEESQAKSSENAADQMDAEAAKQPGDPISQMAAVLFKNRARNERSSAASHRRKAEDLQEEFDSIERQIAELRQKL